MALHTSVASRDKLTGVFVVSRVRNWKDVNHCRVRRSFNSRLCSTRGTRPTKMRYSVTERVEDIDECSSAYLNPEVGNVGNVDAVEGTRIASLKIPEAFRDPVPDGNTAAVFLPEDDLHRQEAVQRPHPLAGVVWPLEYVDVRAAVLAERVHSGGAKYESVGIHGVTWGCPYPNPLAFYSP